MTMLVNVHRDACQADSPPAAFSLGATEYRVEEVLDRWFGSDSTFFKLRADDGNLYILRHNSSLPGTSWTLESFLRQA
jgi:hypothetical protein